MSFSERLTKLREEKGWSQYEVAQRLGIKRPRYNAWESGISKPRADLLNNLAELFDVSTDYLLGMDDAKRTVYGQFEIDHSHDSASPSWASAKDRRDLKKFLENPEGLFFDGIEFSESDREKLLGMMEAMFWEARRLNKEAYKKSRMNKKDQ